MTNTFALKCWTCGLSTMVSGPEPTMGVHIMAATRAVGWTSYVTGFHSVRVLCSERCWDLSLRKDGFPRARRPSGAPNRDGKWDPANNEGLPPHMYPDAEAAE